MPKSLKLKDDLFWNGIQDPELRVFDIIMHTEFGTSYNSYVLKGSEKTAIFETSKLKFWDDYKAAVESVINISDIDYLVMNHTEPDHAGTVEKLLEMNPKLTVVATPTAINFLKEIVNRDFRSMAVKNDDTLSLGDKTLHFMHLPNLHWPDTMYTYVEEKGYLFTCDSFGSHYSHEGVLRSTVTDEEGYLRATKYYFDNIIGPFRNPYMVKALKRIKDLDITMICTGHGPVHDTKFDELFSLYREWCGVGADLEPLAEQSAKKLVVVPYVSAYGYTGMLADKITEGIKAADADIEVHLYDMVTADPSAVLGEIAVADGILFGTPTILGEALAPIWSLTTGMYAPVHKGKLASAFGAYGWSGEGVPNIIERLKQLKLNVLEGFRVKFRPSEVQLLDAYDFGYNFGCVLMGKKNKKKSRGAAGEKVMVKCMVCGEVFDASLGACPVCGVGPDKWTEAPDTSTSFGRDTQERFLIIGGGPGALYAAKAIRERNSTCYINILTDEDKLPYNRPMLTKALLSDFSEDKFAIEPKTFYDENNINVLFNNKVTAIKPAEKQVILESGAALQYDKLIYALGAYCFVAPIKGSDKPHVISIRNIADTDKVNALLPDVKKVVCIGGGVMGLEGAWELKQGGYDVTVLETAPGLLPKQLDDGASAMVEEICNEAGVKIVTGAKITEITDDAVVLEDGTRFEAQMVIMSTGMRPHTAIAQEAGINVDKLIVVDEHMRTSDPYIYAVGDCTEFNGQQQAFWAQAVETGRIAGANAAGEELSYDALGASLVINAMNTSIFALGTNGKDGRKYRTMEVKDDQRHQYEKYYFFNNSLAGVILIGDTSRMGELTDMISAGASFSEVTGR